MGKNNQYLPMAEQIRNNRVKELWQKKSGNTMCDTTFVESNEIRTKHMLDRAQRNMALYSEQRNFDDARANYDKR
jgi:hypothetical protein